MLSEPSSVAPTYPVSFNFRRARVLCYSLRQLPRSPANQLELSEQSLSSQRVNQNLRRSHAAWQRQAKATCTAYHKPDARFSAGSSRLAGNPRVCTLLAIQPGGNAPRLWINSHSSRRQSASHGARVMPWYQHVPHLAYVFAMARFRSTEPYIHIYKYKSAS